MDIDLKKYLDKQFNYIRVKFEDIDRKFEAVNQRFEALEHRLDTIESRLTSVENIQLRMEHNHGDKLAIIFDKLDQFNKHVQDRNIHVNPYPI